MLARRRPRRVRAPRGRGAGAGAARDAADRDPVRGRPYAAGPQRPRHGPAHRLQRPHRRERRPGRRHVHGPRLPVHVPDSFCLAAGDRRVLRAPTRPARRRRSGPAIRSTCSGAPQPSPATGTWKPVGPARRGATIHGVARQVPVGRDRSTSTTSRSRRSASPAPRSPGVTHFAAGAPVTYELVLQRRGAGAFTCALDGGRASPCSSPYTARRRRGRRALADRDLGRRVRCRRPVAGQGPVHRGGRPTATATAGPARVRQLPGRWRTATRRTVTPTASATRASRCLPATSRRSRA